MTSQKPSIPRGTRDFTPLEMVRRNYIFDTIKQVFKLHGFLPIETPAMENLSTLLGKYGDEGDKLLYRILNSGDFLSRVNENALTSGNAAALSSMICDRGLRYDLTVPFARFVVQHQQEITFPFKRYQIQPVWRADRPQKGRYREFYQCDADIVGSNAMINEAEFISIIDTVFSKLNIPVIIKFNNRKILSGIAEILGAGERLTELTVAIDKLDKIGIEKVNEELKNAGFTEEQLLRLEPLFGFRGNTQEKLNFLDEYLKNSGSGVTGIDEIRDLLGLCRIIQLNNELELDISLARGLNYYTGAIIEVKALNVSIGSLCGGGRYDDLTGIFGLPGVSGVGISFGADRIYDVLDQMDAFSSATAGMVKLMFVNFGSREMAYVLPLLARLRSAGIHSELYPDPVKMKKQMSYANSNSIPWVALAGEEEVKNELITLKNMENGEQLTLTPDAFLKKMVDEYHPH